MKSRRTEVEAIGDVAPERVLGAIKEMDHPFAFSGWGYGSSRYTFAGAAPFIMMETSADGATSVRQGDRGSTPPGEQEKLSDSSKDPLDIISAIIEEFGHPAPGPFPFNGGMAGYFGYDLKEYINKDDPKGYKRGSARLKAGRDLSLPCCVAGFYDTIYVYDHSKEEAFIVTTGSGREADFKKRLRDAMLREPGGRSAKGPEAYHYQELNGPGTLRSNTTRAEHIGAIERALEYIAAGDIYQINLSHRLEIPYPGDPLELYLSLLKSSPSPFGSYMDLGSFRLISNSPERFLRVFGRTIETMPIKGTRPRGASPEEDTAIIKELGEDVKERAEHVMIVDLERNDLGRVCLPGSVTVSEFERIETLPGLHHMVSTVRGALAPDVSSINALRAAFPGGSITGAPKIRAMEIIEELEKGPRSIYTGGIGWIDWSGDMDISMAIRTAVHKGSTLYLNVGGGIVADSDPAREYDETILKARSFLDRARGKAPATA
jgi:para-aminobenzoate synthetase component 1